MNVDFTALDYGFDELAGRISPGEIPGVTPTRETIDIRALYRPDDLAGNSLTADMPGFPPFVRGPYATMYASRPWTIRQYAGFSTAEESNAFYRRNLAMGQRLSLIHI